MDKVTYREFNNNIAETEVVEVEKLVSEYLSEPYSLYVYRYFVLGWPELTFIAESEGKMVGVIVCNLRIHKERRKRGYIAMLTVNREYRGKGIAKSLIRLALGKLVSLSTDEVTLETEDTNEAALRLYENMGFIRTRRMHKYYNNSNGAFRLTLPLTERCSKSLQFLPPLDHIL